MWRSALLPIVEKGSAYVWVVQLAAAAIVTRVPLTVQLRAFAWARPRLCPSSWVMTWTLVVPLRYVNLPGT